MEPRHFPFATVAVTVCTLMLFCSSGQAAPAPDDDAAAKKTFLALKQRLPKVVEAWVNELDLGAGERKDEALVQIRSVRRIEATQAKVTIVVSGVDATGAKPAKVEMVIVIFLRYFDGHWTTTRWEPEREKENPDKEIRLLMLAIDESDGD